MPKRVQQISSLLGPLLASAILTLGCLAQAPNPMATPVQDFVDRTHAGDHPAAFNAVLKLAEEVGTAPLPEVEEVLPSIVQAVDDKDPYVRALALTSLVAVESRSNPDHTVRGDALPALEPYIPRIAAHLTDPDPSIRTTTTTVLGGFLSKPPDAVFPPLIAYLQRPDAISTVGSSAVFNLIRLGPQRPAVVAAVIAFLGRPDQTSECLTSSTDAIAHAQLQSEEINTALLRQLNSSNLAVRISLIRDLPELQLPSQLFASTQARIRLIAADGKEDESVRVAASTILPCWVNDRRQPCPAFSLPNPSGPNDNPAGPNDPDPYNPTDPRQV